MWGADRPRPADALRESYLAWRERSAAVTRAYERWARTGWPERTLEFAAYRVALDLEERACRRYAELAEAFGHTRAARPRRLGAAA